MNPISNQKPTPQVIVPRLSKLQLAYELGVLYVIVDGETKLAMNTEQFIEFFEPAIAQAYRIQQSLNHEQQRRGDPTVHVKAGGANLARALLERAIGTRDVNDIAAKVAEHLRQKG